MGIINGSWNSQQVTINEELGAGEAAVTPRWHPPISPPRGRGGSTDLGRGSLVMPPAEPLWVGVPASPRGKNGAGFQEQCFDLCNRAFGARGDLYLLGIPGQFTSLKQ